MAVVKNTKDEMIIYIDSDPNNRIKAPLETLFWRSGQVFYLIPPYSDQLVRIDMPLVKDPKYNNPIYKNYKFVYAHPDETWIKTSGDTQKTGWKLMKYAAPTIGGQQAPIPPTPTPTPWTGSFEGCFTGSFSGSFTGSFIVYNATGDFSGNFYFITNSYFFSGSNYFIGTPTDGYYGSGSEGNVANILVGDKVEDALDKLDTILDKLAPARPPRLSTKTLVLSGGYSAKQSGTNFSVSSITNGQFPLFQLAGGMTASNGFGDGEVGILSASIDGAVVGSKSLSTSDDTGLFGGLEITADYDFYAGQTGKQNFWMALLAQITSSVDTSSMGPHTAKLSHSTTGETPALAFYVDDAVNPTNVQVQITGSGITYISGVPALVGGLNGAAIQYTMSADNTVGRFYNNMRIFSIGGNGVSTSNVPLPNAPTSGSSQFALYALPVNAGTYFETPSFSVQAFNSAGGNASTTLPTTVRIDSTPDPTNRVKSGLGQWGAGYGSAFVTGSDINSDEELQMLNGAFRYPSGNYTSAKPLAGPNYTSVPTGSYNNMRWVTLNMGSISNAANLQLTFVGSSGFTGGGLPMSNFALYIRVDGSTPTSGWVDGNAAYPGVGNPTNNGDAALSVANSTNTLKWIAFGTAIKTGTVYVRVGIPTGDSKRFGSISMTTS